MAGSWVLVDPVGVDLNTGGPLFVGKDGAATGEISNAKTYGSEAEAKQESASLVPANYYIPKPLSDYWPPKKGT